MLLDHNRVNVVSITDLYQFLLERNWPAEGDIGVEPFWIDDRLRFAFLKEVADAEDRQAVVDVAFHADSVTGVISIVVHQAWDHVRGESHDECLSKCKSVSQRESMHHKCCHGQLRTQASMRTRIVKWSLSGTRDTAMFIARVELGEMLAIKGHA